MEVRAIGPCNADRLSKLLAQIVQVKFEILDREINYCSYLTTCESSEAPSTRSRDGSRMKSYLQRRHESINPVLNLRLLRFAQVIRW